MRFRSVLAQKCRVFNETRWIMGKCGGGVCGGGQGGSGARNDVSGTSLGRLR